MASKFLKKKILKKYKSGGLIKSEIAEDPKLAGGGYVMEDVLKKENYPKKAEGGSVRREREQQAFPYQEELKSEVKGMGPEGKAYLRDELKGKKYEGKLKGKYKGDLDKELWGMHKRGKEYLKDLVAKKAKEHKEEKPHKRESDAIKADYRKKKSSDAAKAEYRKKKSVEREGEKSLDAHKREGKSLGQIIESKVLKRKLREKEGIPKKDIVGAAEGGWIQGAVKKPGALRAIAKKDKLIKGDEKLSASDLKTLGAKAKKSGNSLLAKRVSLAKTFAKMRKK